MAKEHLFNFLNLYFIKFFNTHKKSIFFPSKKFLLEYQNYFLSYANYLLKSYQISRSLVVKSQSFYSFVKQKSGRFFLRLHDWSNFLQEKI
jgi:hypothetical protein